MTPGFLLVILTMLDSGGMSAAFINTDTLAKCEQKTKVMQSVLGKGKIDIRTIKCFESDIKFEKFAHKTAKNAPRYSYVISLVDNKVTVAKEEDADACKKIADQNDATYCTTSTQLLVK